VSIRREDERATLGRFGARGNGSGPNEQRRFGGGIRVDEWAGARDVVRVVEGVVRTERDAGDAGEGDWDVARRVDAKNRDRWDSCGKRGERGAFGAV